MSQEHVLTERFSIPDKRARELERIHIALSEGCKTPREILVRIGQSLNLTEWEKLALASMVGSVSEWRTIQDIKFEDLRNYLRCLN